jgi:TolA-binding protein
MKDMQTLHGLRRDYHMARRAVTEKQQKLRDNPDVNKQVTGIDEQIRQLQEQIRTLEESKPGVFRQADESLQADYEKMADVERQIQELEKKLYPGRPVKPAAPGVQGAPPPPPAPPAAPAAPQPPAAPAQDQ